MEEDRDKTTFECHAVYFRYKEMPYELTYALATFQWALDIILSGFKSKTCLLYLNDTIAFSNSVEEHLRHVAVILRILKSAYVSLKISECKFFRTAVTSLRNVVRPEKLEIKYWAIECLKEVLPARNKREPHSFLGLWNVYVLFIPTFAHIASS